MICFYNIWIYLRISRGSCPKMTSRDGKFRTCNENCRSSCDVTAASRVHQHNAKQWQVQKLTRTIRCKRYKWSRFSRYIGWEYTSNLPAASLSLLHQVNYAQIDRAVDQPSQDPGNFHPGSRQFDIGFGRKFVYCMSFFIGFFTPFDFAYPDHFAVDRSTIKRRNLRQIILTTIQTTEETGIRNKVYNVNKSPTTWRFSFTPLAHWKWWRHEIIICT